MNTATVLTLFAMYIIPLGALAWLYSKSKGWALLAIVVIAIALSLGGRDNTSEFGPGPADSY